MMKQWCLITSVMAVIHFILIYCFLKVFNFNFMEPQLFSTDPSYFLNTFATITIYGYNFGSDSDRVTVQLGILIFIIILFSILYLHETLLSLSMLLLIIIIL